MSASASITLLSKDEKATLCTATNVTISSTADGIMMVSGTIATKSPYLSMLAVIGIIPAEPYHVFLSEAEEGYEIPFFQPTDRMSICITSDHGMIKLSENIDYRIGHNGIAFIKKASNVDIKYQGDEFETTIRSFTDLGMQLDQLEYDVLIEADFSGSPVSIKLQKPFAYTRNEQSRIHLRTAHHEPS